MYLHTIIAVGLMYTSYLWGRYLTKNSIMGEIIEHMLMKLEKEGYIITEKDEDGDIFKVNIPEFPLVLKKIIN